MNESQIHVSSKINHHLRIKATNNFHLTIKKIKRVLLYDKNSLKCQKWGLGVGTNETALML